MAGPSPTSRASLLAALLALLAAAAPAGPAQAQEEDLQARRQQTEERLASIQQQIEADQKRLTQTEEAEKSTRKKLEELRREIALREELVATYRDRLDQLGRERRRLRDTLSTLESRLASLRDEYRSRVVHAYKHGRINDLALIFASESINQMLVRVRYLRRFALQRQEKRDEIRSAADALQARRRELDATRERTEELLAEARSERENLERLRDERRQVVEKLRERQSALKAEIAEKRKQARELEQRIQEMVAAAEEASGESAAAASRAASEAASASLSASFADNRGRLPWPVDGVVTESFGNRVDPDYNTTTYNPGILIATNPRSEVRAVFEGTVAGIDFMPGYGTYLVVRHGQYLSTYSNFSSVRVSTGDRVEAGQVIGRAGTENEPRGAGLFFAVFDRSKSASVNPVAWLRDR